MSPTFNTNLYVDVIRKSDLNETLSKLELSLCRSELYYSHYKVVIAIDLNCYLSRTFDQN